MLLLSLLIACQTNSSSDPSPLVADEALPTLQEPVESPQPEPAPEGSVLVMDDWEYAIMSDKLEKLRQGIHLSGPDGLGICTEDPKTKTCSEFLGRNPTSLPEGGFHIQAQVIVPRESSGWEINLVRECTFQDAKPTETNPKVTNWTRKPKGTGQVQTIKLASFTSPARPGNRDCSYTLISLRPDGKEMWRESGQYFIPAL